MITPRFKLFQDENSVTISIRAPYCSLRELDIDIDEGHVFLFVCKPYYLRITLPGEIVDDDRVKSAFDTESGEFSFTYPKKYSGEVFEDLDLITKLLTPKVVAHFNDGSKPIEVLSESQTEQVEVKPFNLEDLEYGFGFALRGHKNFERVRLEFDEVFEVDPCEVPLQKRRKLRVQYEQGKFNVDHYLADLFEDSDICEIISQKCPSLNVSDPCFSDKELDFLKDLPNIQYDLGLESIKYCHNGLLDILFAYCYDQRTTNFEGNIESGWNITKLASTLCWHDAFENPKEVLIASFRRSLIYPLYRHFDLAQTVFEDLKRLIKLEEKYIIRILIKIHDIFLHSDSCRYILNNLFIKDYIIYMMKWNSDLWKATVHEVLSIEFTKEDVGLNLRQIEEGFKLHHMMAAMNITEEESDSDDCSSSEDSSDDSSSSEYSSDSETFSPNSSKASNVTEKST